MKTILRIAVVVITSVFLWAGLHRTERPSSSGLALTYSAGTAHVSIPFDAAQAGAGALIVEVLDPEDNVVAQSECQRQVAAGPGVWQVDLKIPKDLAPGDLVWHRLHYRFAGADGGRKAIEGIHAISQILVTPIIHVIGQTEYLAGAPAAARLIVTNSNNDALRDSGRVRVELLSPGRARQFLFDGRLDGKGTSEVQFRFPAEIRGHATLHFTVDTPIGRAELSQDIRLEDKTAILLTAEKPIYQAGQVIHVRALALNRPSHEPVKGSKLTFEMEDSRGNKVFRSATQTDDYGVASAEFPLADEVNLGAYHLHALMGDNNSAELTLNVDKYVLPKFKVAVEMAQKKHGFRPGDHVTGTVHANYFFGKPVGSAAVVVKTLAMDVALFEAGTSEGKTNEDGDYKFDIQLPAYFAGRPVDQGVARVLVEASVKDNAAHTETRGEPITVSSSPLLVTAIPEGGTLVPGLENQVFLLTSYPDGTPAETEIHANNQTIQTDASGVGVMTLRRDESNSTTLHATVRDREGNRATVTLPLETRAGTDQILLHAERSVYRVGEQMRWKILSTKASGTVYVDIIKDRQTILTRDIDIKEGQGEFDLAATPELSGTVECNAYLFGRNAEQVADRRLLFVQPAEELHVETSLDAAVYKPGDDARISFQVTNNKGKGVQAALGLQIVDEAVFVLAEKQPGFAKVFFYLEQEVMKPRYEIHSLGLPETITTNSHDLAARALFSATQMVRTTEFTGESSRKPEQMMGASYTARYVKHLTAQALSILGNDREWNLRDAWGNPLRLDRQFGGVSLLHSAGPDGEFNTADDLYARIQRPKLRIEHDRGPLNGLVQIAGMVTDATGWVVANADVSVVETSTGRKYKTRTDSQGRFMVSDLRAGTYEVSVSSAGFLELTTTCSLKARDRAVMDATLNVASARQMVQVEAMAPQVVTTSANITNMAFAKKMEVIAAPPPPPAMDRAVSKTEEAAAAPTHLRSYFPEALYINPEIITDRSGRASITVPLADNITTWRMAILASSAHGALGTASSNLKVFQDFFVDLDLPVTVTQGDQVTLPVAIYNYAGSSGDIALQLEPADWYSLVDDSQSKSVKVEAGRVGGSQFAIQANRIGKFKLMLKAQMSGGTKRADLVVREIEVVPNGREQTKVFNGNLDGTAEHQMDFPADAIADARTIFVRVYPGPMSQIVEGMDGLLRMPNGCFEQTSSSTYPNVLALDYMKRTKKVTPEIRAKAEGYITNGYQRLLTFEVPGGGFSWFGKAPANKILTSYGLMEFSDMSKVHDVDPRLIERTQEWLAGQQQADGSWKPDQMFINEGATNRYNSDVLRITAYIAWALENTGYQGPAVEKAKGFIESHLSKADPYTLAVVANFAADYAKGRNFTHEAVQALLSARTEKGDQTWWDSEETAVYGTGTSAAVETTGLAIQALLKSGENQSTTRKALSYITASKSAAGAWGTTQATIMALRALLLASEKGGATAKGTLEVLLNGKTTETLALNDDNSDLLHQFVFHSDRAEASNRIELRFTGEGSVAYQLAGRYFLPWTVKPEAEPLSLNVTYDRTHLVQDDIATAVARVRNNLPKRANMIMVDLGIPPGFEFLSEDLQDYREKSASRKSGRLEKFNLTATQAILYFDSIAAHDEFAITFRLRAKYPIRARTFASHVYEYYDPDVRSVARPEQLEVDKR